MKLIRYTLFFVLFTFFQSILAEDIPAKKVTGKVDSVILYSDRALVRRVQAVDLSKSQGRVTFTQLPEKLDPGSIRVSGKGISISGILVRKIPTNRNENYENHPLRLKMEVITKKIRSENDLISNYQTQLQLLKSFAKLTTMQTDRDISRKSIDVEDWAKAMRFIESSRTQYQKKIRLTENKIKNLNKEYNKTYQKFREETSGKKYYPLEVDVSYAQGADKSGEIILEYITKGVSWVGAYELRGDLEKGEFRLLSSAKIRQNTGENWDSVKLTLSTARPVEGTSPGFLQPWRIRPGNMGQTGKGKIRDRRDKDDDMNSFADDETRALESEPEFSNAAEGAEVTMKIPTRESIKSDYSEHRVKLHDGKLSAKMSYIAIPSISKYVFIKARIKNTLKIPLVPGDMSLFPDGNFVGNTRLSSYTAVGEEFDVFLGPDQRFQIKRKLIKGEIVNSGLIGKKVQLLNQWQVEVANYSNKKRQVIVYDQFPIAADPNITTKFIGSNDKNVEKDANGILKWTVNLSAGSKKKFNFSYTISVPIAVWNKFMKIQKSKPARKSQKNKLYEQIQEEESLEQPQEIYNVEDMFMK
ncbi:MAG: mucoidy inhibitor MuiA family protein [Leptospirales bacterium]